MHHNDDAGSTLVFVGLSVECMERMPCCPWTNRMYVCVAAFVLELGGVVYDRCSMRLSLCAVQIHYNGNDGSACGDLCLLNVWNGCHVGPGRTARAFSLLRACLNLKALLLFDAV